MIYSPDILVSIKMNFEKMRLSIAERAQEAIGLHFRLHGRSIGTGLDCVGLIAHAIKPIIMDIEIPRNYSLRFDDINIPIAFFEAHNFERIDSEQGFLTGDIAIIAPAAQQLHFIIIAQDGYIHAHSGLRKIVKTNFPILSPVKAAWRYAGD